MKNGLFLAVALLASTAHAESTTQPRSRVSSVVAELRPSLKEGTGISISCDDGTQECRLTWTPDPGKVSTFTDWNAQKGRLEGELAAIEAKSDKDLTLSDMIRAFRILMTLRK